MDRGGERNTAQKKQLLEYAGTWRYWIYRILITEKLSDQEESLGDKSEDTMLSWYMHTETSTSQKRSAFVRTVQLGTGMFGSWDKKKTQRECINNKKCLVTLCEEKKRKLNINTGLGHSGSERKCSRGTKRKIFVMLFNFIQIHS